MVCSTFSELEIQGVAQRATMLDGGKPSDRREQGSGSGKLPPRPLMQTHAPTTKAKSPAAEPPGRSNATTSNVFFLTKRFFFPPRDAVGIYVGISTPQSATTHTGCVFRNRPRPNDPLRRWSVPATDVPPTMARNNKWKRRSTAGPVPFGSGAATQPSTSLTFFDLRPKKMCVAFDLRGRRRRRK